MGDIHGDFYIIERRLHTLEEGSLLIQVGDFGVGFRPASEKSHFEEINKILEKKNITLYVIRGNHDDPSLFGTTHGRIHLLEDYTFENINGKDWLFIGGATSIDRIFRRAGTNYWPEEKLNCQLQKVKKCDVLVTHSAPAVCAPHDDSASLWNVITMFVPEIHTNERCMLHNELAEERQRLTEIFEKAKPSHLYYGHFHFKEKEIVNGCYCRLLHCNEIETFSDAIPYTNDLKIN